MKEPEKKSKTKRYNFSNEDRAYLLKFLSDLDVVNRQKVSIESYIKSYVVEIVLPKLGIQEGTKVEYSIVNNEIFIIEEEPEILLPNKGEKK